MLAAPTNDPMRFVAVVLLGSFVAACSSAAAPGQAAGVGSSGGTAEAGSEVDEKQHLADTAEGAASEERPTGVPTTWDWVAGATSTRTTAPDQRYTHANYWGAIFRGPRDTTPANTLVAVRNCSMWFLGTGASEWTKAPASPALEGSTFSPTYASGGPQPIVLTAQAAGANVVPAVGHIWHFWQANGYQRVLEQVEEVVVNCQAQLQLRVATGVDDRAEADYLIHVGADFRDPADPSCAQDQGICPSWGVSRMERVTREWQNHTFHSLTKADLESPKPLPPRAIFDLTK